MDITISKQDNIYFKIDADYSIHKEINDTFTVFAKDYYFHPKFRNGVWDGKLKFYKLYDQLLPAGLFWNLVSFCKKNEYTYKCNFNENEVKSDITPEQVQVFSDIIFKDSKMDPYVYQKEAVFKALKFKRGLLLMPTGSGKSLVLYTLIRFLLGLKKEILLVVPTTSLVEQMYSDFEEYGWKNIDRYVCRLHGKRVYDESKPILISTWQSIYKKKEEFFSRFGGLLIDECLHPDTEITMEDGRKKKIKEIQEMDIVKSYNIDNNRIEDKKVLKVHKNLIKSNNESCFNIEDDKGNIYFKDGITGNHEVNTINGLKAVKDLKEGDEIVEI